MHCSYSKFDPTHEEPPHFGDGELQSRLLFLLPELQETEQEDHDDQTDHFPSTLQQKELQNMVSSKEALQDIELERYVRFLKVIPESHDFEHGDHSDH